MSVGPIDAGGDPRPGGSSAADQRLTGPLRSIDHATSWVERPIRRLAGSARLNPLPHAGTISVFLLAVVVVSGLYITLFFEFGHEASYRSVAAMEDHAIQKVIRALHRYASAVLVVTTVVHGWRIFAAGRFTGRLRRWRWATGVSALVLVWLAGVTGYWLVWDVRAQGLNEVVLRLIGDTGPGVELAIGQLGVVGGRSGSGFLLVIWFAHIALTATIGLFIWRHLRRAKQPWLPPPHWMAVMGIPLVLVSLAVPVGMLAPADPGTLIGEIPIDPFVLFLLPPLLSDWAWPAVAIVVIVGLVVLLLPRLLRRRDPAVISIVEESCTGCELCVADCPYDALEMVDRSAGEPVGTTATDATTTAAPTALRDRRRLLAVVDPMRCVGCGVCLGSCAFGAIDLPGSETPAALDVEGRALAIVCDRHLDGLSGLDDETVIHPVRCAGALSPDTLGTFTKAGATDIQLVGCAPSDCRYGIGNTLASQRLAGERRPHPPGRYARRVTQDWVAGDQVVGALSHPGEHPSLDTSHPPVRRESLLGVGAIAVLTVVAVAFATRAPFGQPTDEVALRLVVDHRPGEALAVDEDGGAIGSIDQVEVTLTPSSGDPTVALVDGPVGGERWSTIVDLSPADLDQAEIGRGDEFELEVVVRSDERAITVIDRPIGAVDGRRVVIDLTDDPPPPGVEDGRRIFTSRQGGCDVCHSVERGDDGVGPSLFGVASVAGSRVEGLDAEGYFRQSLLLPDQYVVDGWPAGQMLPIYRERFSADELDAVIRYLLTLEDPTIGGSGDSEGSDG